MNYTSMTKAELLNEAKKCNVVGRWDMTKEELISTLTKVEHESTIMIDPTQYKDTSGPQRSTIDYAKKAEVGTIIAFKVTLGGKNRVLSAVINASDSDFLLVETKNGSKYRVRPDDVIWVKTGSRWPKWVLESLKGIHQQLREESQKDDNRK